MPSKTSVVYIQQLKSEIVKVDSKTIINYLMPTRNPF